MTPSVTGLKNVIGAIVRDKWTSDTVRILYHSRGRR